MRKLGVEKDFTDYIDLFSPEEGSINLYYGRIGNGKTYNATADIIQDLKMGHIVYCNWRINLDEISLDETDSLVKSFFNMILFQKRYYSFKKSNLRYFDSADIDLTFLAQLSDCKVYIDEGQWIFDSYEKTDFSKAKRKLLLHTRHEDRVINIITQRPNAIQVTARAQVNRFFKCSKLMSWPFLVFRKEEFQDMVANEVQDAVDPVNRTVYFARKSVLKAYNTKYLRSGIRIHPDFVVYELNFVHRVLLLSRNFFRLFAFLRKRKEEEPLGDKLEITAIKNSEGLNTIGVGGNSQEELPF